MSWPSHRVDDTVEVPAAAVPLEPGPEDPKAVHIQGILFTPPDCETVVIACTPTGRLSSPINLEAAPLYPEPELVYSVHVKTQFAGPDTHAALVLLLKYLEKKYFRDMEVYDEGEYWDSLDKARLESQFRKYRSLINLVKSALEQEKRPAAGDAGKLADQIEALLRKRFGRSGEEGEE